MASDDEESGQRFAWEWPEAQDDGRVPEDDEAPDDHAPDDHAPDDEAPDERSGGPPRIDYVALLRKQIAEAEEKERQRERLQRLRTLAAPVARRRVYPLDVGRQRGSSPAMSVRLPRWLEEQIRGELEGLGVTPSAALRQLLEEWWVGRRYPALEFRSADFLRTAAIRGGPTVSDWVAADPRPALPDDVREQVLDYVELFRMRIEDELRRPSSRTPPRCPR